MSKFKLPSKKQVNDLITFKYLNLNSGANRKGRVLSISFTEEYVLYEVYAFETGEIYNIKENQLVIDLKEKLIHTGDFPNQEPKMERETLRIRNVEVDVYDKVVIFTYKGKGDPDEALSDEIKIYAGGRPYKEFVDIDMDNPFTTIIVLEK